MIQGRLGTAWRGAVWSGRAWRGGHGMAWHGAARRSQARLGEARQGSSISQSKGEHLRIALWNWHTPYTYLLARALPEHTIYTLPTPYAPEGWLYHQRPMPENVFVTAAPDAADDVLIAQTGQDLERAAADYGWEGPMLYLAHNHADLDPVSRWPLAMQEPLVCISEMKAQSWQNAGYSARLVAEDRFTVIPPGIPPGDYGGWIGKEPCILTVCNNSRRPLFDLGGWLEATRDLPTLLVGEGNEGIPGAMGPAKSWEELKGFYRDCRVYLNPTCPPYEDPFNLAALEALATGCPVRNLGPYIGKEPKLEDFSWEKFKERWGKVLREVVE